MNLLQPRVAVIPVGAHKGFGHPHAVVVDNVLLARAPCVTATPALVLQTDEGHPEGSGTSFSGFVVGDVENTTDSSSSYRIEAGSEIRGGSSERRAAGLPLEMCMATETALCLNDERFRVTIDWRTPPGDSGPGRAERPAPPTRSPPARPPPTGPDRACAAARVEVSGESGPLRGLCSLAVVAFAGCPPQAAGRAVPLQAGQAAAKQAARQPPPSRSLQSSAGR